MSDRWIEVNNHFVNLSQVTHLSVRDRWRAVDDDNNQKVYEVVAYLSFGYPASEYAGVDSMQEDITLVEGYEVKEDAMKLARNIIKGKYDMPTPDTLQTDVLGEKRSELMGYKCPPKFEDWCQNEVVAEVGSSITIMLHANGNPSPTYAADDLPMGFKINPETGTISGTFVEPALLKTYVVAENSEGTAVHIIEFQIKEYD